MFFLNSEGLNHVIDICVASKLVALGGRVVCQTNNVFGDQIRAAAPTPKLGRPNEFAVVMRASSD